MTQPESMCGGMGAVSREAATMPPAGEPDAKEPSAQALPFPSNPPGWAVLEIMGHRKRAGWVESVRVFGTDLARVYLPGDGDRSTWLYEDYSGASIFAISWCDEARALAAAAEIARAMQWDRPFVLRALPPAAGPSDLKFDDFRRIADHEDDDEPSAGDEPQDEDRELAF